MANKSTPELLELIDYNLSKLEKLTDIAAAVNTLGTIPQAHARITLAGALSGQITDIAWDARIAQQYFEDLAELLEKDEPKIDEQDEEVTENDLPFK